MSSDQRAVRGEHPSRARLLVTSRGWAVSLSAIVLLGFGAWAQYPGVLGFGLALAALMICGAIGLTLRIPVTIRRAAKPPRVARLDAAAATLEVTNTSGRYAIAVEGYDVVAGEPSPFELPRLAPGRKVTTEVPIPTAWRGIINFGPLILGRKSLADVLRLRRQYGSFTTVLVEPRILDAVGLPPGARRGHTGADERIAHGGTDLVGMREYQRGDDLRRVHWSTSARRGMLMVREDADPSAPHLTVLLDDRSEVYNGDGFEEAVDVAASLLATAAEVSSPARILTFSGLLDMSCDVDPVLGALDREVLGQLARVTTRSGLGDSAQHLFSGAPDVLAIVTGPHADLAPLLLDASAAPAGIIMIIDETPEAFISVRQGVTILSGPRAEEIVHSWRTVVAQ